MSFGGMNTLIVARNQMVISSHIRRINEYNEYLIQLDTDYDIGKGLLDYPKPLSIWQKLKKALHSFSSVRDNT